MKAKLVKRILLTLEDRRDLIEDKIENSVKPFRQPVTPFLQQVDDEDKFATPPSVPQPTDTKEVRKLKEELSEVDEIIKILKPRIEDFDISLDDDKTKWPNA